MPQTLSIMLSPDAGSLTHKFDTAYAAVARCVDNCRLGTLRGFFSPASEGIAHLELAPSVTPGDAMAAMEQCADAIECEHGRLIIGIGAPIIHEICYAPGC